jgi:tetratricopeptide (TPR) repeat protein
MIRLRPLAVVALGAVLSLNGAKAHAEPSEQAATQAMKRAQEHMLQKDYAAAAQAYDEARALAPDASGPYLGLGLAHAAQGHCQEAVPALEEYLKRKGDDPQPGAKATLEACRALAAVSPGRLSVVSEPGGAEVRVDDEKAPAIGVTPFETDKLPPGAHVVFVSKPGFHTRKERVSLERGLTARLEVALTALEAKEQPRGRLDVRVTPKEARLRLDETVLAARTRSFQGPVPIGRHRLTVESAGYLPSTAELDVKDGETVTRSFTLVVDPTWRPPKPPPPPPVKKWPIVLGVVSGVVAAAALGFGLGFGLQPKPLPMEPTFSTASTR